MLLLSLFWTNSVLSNIVHATTSASIYCWWMLGMCNEDDVKHFFQRITSKSLGSICFGSLLTAFIRTLRSILAVIYGWMSKKPEESQSNRYNYHTVLATINRYCHSLIRNLLRMLDKVIVYCNRYALCFVGIYGVSYLQASKLAVQLFQNRGMTTLFNDDIIDCILFISELVISIICLIAAYIYARVSDLNSANTTLITTIGFVIGFVFSHVVLSLIQSAVTTVYVSFAKDPSAFEKSHPLLYVPLANAWCKIFPGCLNMSQPNPALNQNAFYANNASFPTDNTPEISNPLDRSRQVGDPNQQGFHRSPSENSIERTIKGSYNTNNVGTATGNQGNNNQRTSGKSSSLYSSVMMMVQPLRNPVGYEAVDTLDDVDHPSGGGQKMNNWNPPALVANFSRAVKAFTSSEPFAASNNFTTKGGYGNDDITSV